MKTTAPTTPPLFWYLVAAFAACAMVPTFLPNLDLWTSARYVLPSGLLDAPTARWVDTVNLYTPFAFRLFLGTAFAAWLLLVVGRYSGHWRKTLGFIVLAGVLGPGFAVNVAVKPVWQRARPHDVVAFGGTQKFTPAYLPTQQCTHNCAFVSGHVACGAFFMSLMLAMPRRRNWWAGVGGVAALGIAYARISAGDHWLSDTLWAVPLTLLTSLLVWQLMSAWQSRNMRRTS